MRHAWVCALGLAFAACSDDSSPFDGVKPPEGLEYAHPEPWVTGTGVPPPGPGGRVIITNSLDDTLSLLELEGATTPGWRELARVPVGLNPVELEGPHHTAVSPDGSHYYVGISNYVPGGGSGPHGAHGSGADDGYCLKLDARDNRLVGSVRVDPNPGDVIVSKDGNTLYQTHFDTLKIAEVARRGGIEKEMYARLAIIDAKTMTRKAMVDVCPAPHAIRLSADERTAYIACWSDEVAIVDLSAPTTEAPRVKVANNAGTATAPRHQPYALTMSPTTGDVFVSSMSSREVQVLEARTHAMNAARTIRLAGSPMFGDISADGATLYMPYQGVEALAIIDAATGFIRREVDLAPAGCLNAHQAKLTPDESHALVVCEGDHVRPGTLHSVNLAQGTVVNTVRVGIFPDSVSILRGQP
ncbi:MULTISPECIES: YncE family protein [Myxococcus]|uniref:YncE family protein n=1 Tax=Myxococcus llanfairpwllgwyngyllgogerychwyrndrobwllllantysiliogogogochensis TaxID=2590453 RepID=A0A540XB45_9BACT|nr:MULTISPECIES: YncE family protein [Myxococcus]NTX02615.1 YncE family protein [Myxococcus sp. CA040A]TQF17904.1 YncE family protein [Myxococcus llanfairpwllgwyngyllgogerychwyrndrobwllllantysiliogogogochensis]